jgi:hypothetical protein
MTTNERTHMNTVFDQFGELKGKVDNLVAMASITGSSDLTMFAPITMGADGVPVFAVGTAGQLNYISVSAHPSRNCSINVGFNYGLDAAHPNFRVNAPGGGQVELYTSNRYYVEQWVAYENGALLVKQRDGQLVRAFPSFEVTTSGPLKNVTLSFTQINLVGTNATVTGAGTTGLNINLIYLDQQQYTNLTFPSGSLTYLRPSFTINTTYGQAWYNYLDTLLRINNHLTPGVDYDLNHIGSDYHTIQLLMKKVVLFKHNVATVEMSVQNA